MCEGIRASPPATDKIHEDDLVQWDQSGREFVCESSVIYSPPLPPSHTREPSSTHTHTYTTTASRALLYRKENSTSKSHTSVIHSEVKKQVSCCSVHVGSFYARSYLPNTSRALAQQAHSWLWLSVFLAGCYSLPPLALRGYYQPCKAATWPIWCGFS